MLFFLKSTRQRFCLSLQNNTKIPFEFYSPRSRWNQCLEESEKSINLLVCQNLTWTSWNLDKHHIVKDSAEVVVSWPWNKLMTVSLLYWHAVPCYCLITSNMKVSTSSRMSSSVRRAPSCDAWSIKSRKASRRFTPTNVHNTINIIFISKH